MSFDPNFPQDQNENNSQNFQDHPNYYGILPAHVRYDKKIEAGAKALYTELTALSNQYGYCWATNDYFAKLYEVDRTTIVRWIKSLKNRGYIVVETNRNTFPLRRKIFINTGFQKTFTEVQKCTDHRCNFAPPNSKALNIKKVLSKGWE